MKDYLNFEGLSYFFNKLLSRFSIIGHTHTVSDITDLSESQGVAITATDDDNGNVTLITKYGVAADDSNTYLVVNN